VGAALLVGGQLEAGGEQPERGRQPTDGPSAPSPRVSAGQSGMQPRKIASVGTRSTATSCTSQRGMRARSYSIK